MKELSAFYLDVLKDRLYTDSRRSVAGRSCRTALHEILVTLTRVLAPVLAFTSEEVWASLGTKGSVHAESWPKAEPRRRNVALEQKWERLFAIRERVTKAIEERREKKEIGNSLEAAVKLTLSQKDDLDFLRAFGDELPFLFVVSRVELENGQTPDGVSVAVAVTKAPDAKCERCWNLKDTVGKDREHPTLCHRCVEVIKGV